MIYEQHATEKLFTEWNTVKGERIVNKTVLLLIAAVAAVLIGWLFVQISQTPGETMQGELVQVPGGSYRDIASEQLSIMQQKKDFVLINVHIPYGGELPQTDLFISFNAIEQNTDKLPQDKATKVVLYCMSGRMSAIAAETMVNMGYTNVWNLKEGMLEWKAKGYTLLNFLK